MMVFRYPPDPPWTTSSVSLVPGDRVEYIDKRLTINGVLVETSKQDDYLNTDRLLFAAIHGKLGVSNT